jgi:hypothetical protein
MGREARTTMCASLRETNYQYTTPRKRNLTENPPDSAASEWPLPWLICPKGVQAFGGVVVEDQRLSPNALAHVLAAQAVAPPWSILNIATPLLSEGFSDLPLSV